MVWKELTLWKMWPIFFTNVQFLCFSPSLVRTVGVFVPTCFWRLLLLWNGGSMMQLHTTPWGGAAQVSLASRLIKNGVKASLGVDTEHPRWSTKPGGSLGKLFGEGWPHFPEIVWWYLEWYLEKGVNIDDDIHFWWNVMKKNEERILLSLVLVVLLINARTLNTLLRNKSK